MTEKLATFSSKLCRNKHQDMNKVLILQLQPTSGNVGTCFIFYSIQVIVIFSNIINHAESGILNLECAKQKIMKKGNSLSLFVITSHKVLVCFLNP